MAEEAAPHNVRTLFDVNLPDEIVQHVLHMLSARPRHAYPLCFVSPRDVHHALGATEQLRDAALKMFTTVEMCDYYPLLSAWQCKASSYKLNGEPPGLCVKDELSLSIILNDLGSTLQKLTVRTACNADHLWVKVLARQKSPITELSVEWHGGIFPLGDLLSACGSLKRLCLRFGRDSGTVQDMECVAKHASNVSELQLVCVDPSGGFGHIWPRLLQLEVLTIRPSEYREVYNLYDGIAHDNSRLCKLALGFIGNKSHLSATMNLCQTIGHRLRDLEFCLGVSKDSVHMSFDDELLQLKDSCPYVAVRLICKDIRLTPVIRSLGDSLVDLHSTNISLTDADDLTACDAALPNMRSVSLLLRSSLSVKFLEVFLDRVGSRLCELTVGIFSFFDFKTLEATQVAYLDSVARHTGNLLRLQIDTCCNPSLRPIAAANPSIRGLKIRICKGIEPYLAYHPHVLEKWIVKTVDDFITSCPLLEDIVFEDATAYDGVLKNATTRITALDAYCLTGSRRRRVGVRVASMFYDI